MRIINFIEKIQAFNFEYYLESTYDFEIAPISLDIF